MNLPLLREAAQKATAREAREFLEKAGVLDETISDFIQSQAKWRPTPEQMATEASE